MKRIFTLLNTKIPRCLQPRSPAMPSNDDIEMSDNSLTFPTGHTSVLPQSVIDRISKASQWDAISVMTVEERERILSVITTALGLSDSPADLDATTAKLTLSNGANLVDLDFNSAEWFKERNAKPHKTLSNIAPNSRSFLLIHGDQKDSTLVINRESDRVALLNPGSSAVAKLMQRIREKASASSVVSQDEQSISAPSTEAAESSAQHSTSVASGQDFLDKLSARHSFRSLCKDDPGMRSALAHSFWDKMFEKAEPKSDFERLAVSGLRERGADYQPVAWQAYIEMLTAIGDGAGCTAKEICAAEEKALAKAEGRVLTLLTRGVTNPKVKDEQMFVDCLGLHPGLKSKSKDAKELVFEEARPTVVARFRGGDGHRVQ